MRILVRSLTASLAALFITFLLCGQSMTGRITGTIVDEEGAPLSGVTVLAINVSSNAEIKGQTEKQGGRFRLLGLPPGTYQVSFELPGYITFVAAGVKLQTEQSINLRITLKRNSAVSDITLSSALPETQSREDGQNDQGPAGFGRRLSLAINVGLNYLAVGDCNDYLIDHNRRYGIGYHYRLNYNSFDTFNSGSDLNAELGYRISPRLELAAGLGLYRGSQPANTVSGDTWAGTMETKRIDTSIKALPVQLILRYWLGRSGGFTYSLQGGVFINFATWKMRTHEGGIINDINNTIINIQSITDQWASARGLGFTVGGRGEIKMDEHVNFIIDSSWRWAPVRNFSGWRETHMPDSNQSTVIQGRLWLYEYYDEKLKRWMLDLGVRDRPTGPETRNVSTAEVDFSGLALRFGLLIHF